MSRIYFERQLLLLFFSECVCYRDGFDGFDHPEDREDTLKKNLRDFFGGCVIKGRGNGKASMEVHAGKDAIMVTVRASNFFYDVDTDRIPWEFWGIRDLVRHLRIVVVLGLSALADQATTHKFENIAAHLGPVISAFSLRRE